MQIGAMSHYMEVRETAMLGSYLLMSAWKEILARTFEGFEGQDNVSPKWLVNPATRRRLKLDRYYPDIGIAFRYVGLTAKGQGRQSDWEVLEGQQRDQTRSELCRLNNVHLCLLDPYDDPLRQMDKILRTLSRASRTLAQSTQPATQKNKWMPALSEARTRASELRGRLAKAPEQMIANWAESWRDRETGVLRDDAEDTQTAISAQNASESVSLLDPNTLVTDLRVHHIQFGDGVITEINGEDDDQRITILFDGAEQKTFLAALVQNKLKVVD